MFALANMVDGARWHHSQAFSRLSMQDSINGDLVTLYQWNIVQYSEPVTVRNFTCNAWKPNSNNNNKNYKSSASLDSQRDVGMAILYP